MGRHGYNGTLQQKVYSLPSVGDVRDFENAISFTEFLKQGLQLAHYYIHQQLLLTTN